MRDGHDLDGHDGGLITVAPAVGIHAQPSRRVLGTHLRATGWVGRFDMSGLGTSTDGPEFGEACAFLACRS